MVIKSLSKQLHNCFGFLREIAIKALQHIHHHLIMIL
jgi:hypothetical protein